MQLSYMPTGKTVNIKAFALTLFRGQVYSTDAFYLVCREEYKQSHVQSDELQSSNQQHYTAVESIGANGQYGKVDPNLDFDIVVDRKTFQIRPALPYESW